MPLIDRTIPVEFTAVLKLANHYVATHSDHGKISVLTKNLECDVRVAHATAQVFSVLKDIPNTDTVLTLEQPLLTVCKKGDMWYPAELHPDKIVLIKKMESLNLGGTKEEAIENMKAIALIRKAGSDPGLGISMARS